jgi:F0F1-type ATP synthase membrane subunit b/b'
MKRLILTLALGLAVATTPAIAQEHEKKAEEHGSEAGHEKKDEGNLEIWKWLNFLILAGGLGYMIGKNAGPFFANRSASIRKDLEDSLRQSKEAEARAAEVDRRLATLESQIASLRAESDQELKAGAARISQQTADELAKVQAHAAQEMASAGKQARSELKRYSAELAMGLAEQKVRARMTPGTQDGLVDSFVRDLK